MKGPHSWKDYHQIHGKNTTTGATSGVGAAYSTRAHHLTVINLMYGSIFCFYFLPLHCFSLFDLRSLITFGIFKRFNG